MSWIYLIVAGLFEVAFTSCICLLYTSDAADEL